MGKGSCIKAGTEIKGFVDWRFEVDEIAFWWPGEYGNLLIYEVEIVLMDAKVTVPISPLS
jgi:hypothetical protein